ncbi:Conserved hypothetical protein CHP02687 [Bacteroides coprosuis DSM 18011]|uniref:Uncharacterized protein n=1 Tax=Bacteroides coprosuis DSM 18011 TaxID=679937 RepID=F3ZRF0_9BACE|nr:BREX-1 system phosphatase PglZ type A [Bacteroides coprosuis]EGJ71958.1 Conserved hypothetical protein CHP02687 [Bacteroides coprosuis DSM 18011]
MKARIEESLLQLFQKYRILVWYDEHEEFTSVFETLELGDILKEKVAHNEFAIKYNVYIKHPEEKFLLYIPYKRPVDEYNWLLDIEESNKLFATDQVALLLQDMELPIRPDTKAWVSQHIEFFNSKERLRAFKKAYHPEDSLDQLSLKLCQVVFGSSVAQVDEMLQYYAQAFLEEEEERLTAELERYQLNKFFWNDVLRLYSQVDSSKRFLLSVEDLTISDFLIQLFRKNWTVTASDSLLNESAIVLINSWKDSFKFAEAFEELSHQLEERLNIVNIVAKVPLEQIIQEDLYESFDQEIIRGLVRLIAHQSKESDKLLDFIKQRSHTYWYAKYKSYYQALVMAIQYREYQSQTNSMSCYSYAEVLKSYTEDWYKADYFYRKFIQYFRETHSSDLLYQLATDIENSYNNDWLLHQSEKWQRFVDKQEEWYWGDKSQHKFYSHFVKPRFLDAKRKTFVIISDALRYECGVELHQRITSTENRLSSELDYLFTGLPSYTQLGMAALLPHTELSFGNGDAIDVDGMSSVGTLCRDKILKTNSTVHATAITAEEVMQMSSRGEEAKRLVQENDLIYIYHNQIDKIGDDKTSEEKLVKAVEDELDYLINLVKKLTNMNATHILLTADHGFLYQYQSLEESDYISEPLEGDIEILNRRYILGQNLVPNSNFKVYSAKELKIVSDYSIAIPKGINRLRRQGSGSRYVHGGGSLQECITPLLYIQRKRKDTLREVDVDVINQANNRITTNQHRVQFYQKEPIGKGVVARDIKAYFATSEDDGKDVISDIFTYTLDKKESRSQDREIDYLFTISSHKTTSSEVFLYIECRIRNSNQWESLKKFRYKLSVAIERDFFF